MTGDSPAPRLTDTQAPTRRIISGGYAASAFAGRRPASLNKTGMLNSELRRPSGRALITLASRCGGQRCCASGNPGGSRRSPACATRSSAPSAGLDRDGFTRHPPGRQNRARPDGTDESMAARGIEGPVVVAVVGAGSIGVQASRRGSIEYECQECHAHFSPSPVLAALTPIAWVRGFSPAQSVGPGHGRPRFRGTTSEQLAQARRPGPPVVNHRLKQLRPRHPLSAAATPPLHRPEPRWPGRWPTWTPGHA